jgi:hypothetical protein
MITSTINTIRAKQGTRTIRDDQSEYIVDTDPTND